MRRAKDRGSDDGVVIVWALALVTILLLVSAVGGMVAAQAQARGRAAAVADLAAVAGAQASDDPCAAAADLVVANDARLDACVLDGTDVVVTVSVDLPTAAHRLAAMSGGTLRAVRATSRAGPP